MQRYKSHNHHAKPIAVLLLVLFSPFAENPDEIGIFSSPQTIQVCQLRNCSK